MTYDNSRPAYRVLAVAGFYADDHLYGLEDELYFDGKPNEELEPLNQAAVEKMEAYLTELDDLGRIAAEKAGKAYTSRPRNLEGGLELATAVQRSQTAVMGHLAHKENKQSEKIIHDETVPETGSITPRGKRGRPPGSAKIKGPQAI